MTSTTSLFGKLYCNDRCNDSATSKLYIKSYRSQVENPSSFINEPCHRQGTTT